MKMSLNIWIKITVLILHISTVNGDCVAAVDVLFQISYTVSSYDTTDAEEFINHGNRTRDNIITIEDVVQCQIQIKRLQDLKDAILMHIIRIRTKIFVSSRNIHPQCYILKEILQQIHFEIETAFKCYTLPIGIISLAFANNAIQKKSPRNLRSLGKMDSTISYLKECWKEVSPLKKELDAIIRQFEDL